MTKLFSILLLSLLLLENSQASRSLRVGLFSVPPHIFATTPPRGASVDYIRKFANEHGYQIKWLGQVPFPRLITMLKSGEIDLVPLISKTDEREKFLLFPKREQFRSLPTLIVRKSSAIKEIKTAKDLEGLNIGYIQGAVLPILIRDNRETINFTFIGSDDWTTKGANLLNKGWLDGILTLDHYSILYKMKVSGLNSTVRGVRIPTLGEIDKAYTAISKKSPVAKELKQQLDLWTDSQDYEKFVAPYLDN